VALNRPALFLYICHIAQAIHVPRGSTEFVSRFTLQFNPRERYFLFGFSTRLTLQFVKLAPLSEHFLVVGAAAESELEAPVTLSGTFSSLTLPNETVKICAFHHPACTWTHPFPIRSTGQTAFLCSSYTGLPSSRRLVAVVTTRRISHSQRSYWRTRRPRSRMVSACAVIDFNLHSGSIRKTPQTRRNN